MATRRLRGRTAALQAWRALTPVAANARKPALSLGWIKANAPYTQILCESAPSD
jgi:hypothetical protein